MLKRTIVGVVAALFAITIIAFRYTPALVIALAAFCVLATREIEKVVGLKNKAIYIISLIFSGLVPFYYEYSQELCDIGIVIPVKLVIAVYIVLLFILMLTDFKNTKFEEVATVIIASTFVPWAFSTLIMINDFSKVYPEYYDKHYDLFFLLFGLFCAWLSDTFAYFTGRFLGKHKLCPSISPKKTIEGFIGGIVGAVISTVILFAVFDNCYFTVHSMNYIEVIIITVILSAVGVCGNLTASVIKRNFGVKDFGNLFPGHGGVMDRFDSALFVLSMEYVIITLMRTVG